MHDIDRQIMDSLAGAEGMGVYSDAVYTPPDGADPISPVHVTVDDLISETSGEITQGGAVLALLRAEVATPVQGAEVSAGGEVWRITRRLSTTDPSSIRVEAKRK